MFASIMHDGGDRGPPHPPRESEDNYAVLKPIAIPVLTSNRPLGLIISLQGQQKKVLHQVYSRTRQLFINVLYVMLKLPQKQDRKSVV